MNYEEAKQCLINGQIKKCIKFFEENHYALEYGYCLILSNNIDKALKVLQPIREQDMRADWACLLTQFIKNYIQFFPSYLQIRNFLELDIALLIKSKQTQAVENVINACDIFYQINQESYKFIARVLLNNGYPEISKIFLDKGVEKCYQDPELHFLYGNYHLLHKNTILAKHEFETCLEVLPNYYPAKMMLDKV